jgi:hypothetical protein
MHVARVGGEKVHTRFGWGHLREEDFEDPDFDGRILKWIFKKWDEAYTGSIWLRTGTGGGIL